MGNTVVCKLGAIGSLYSMLYILHNGEVIYEEQCNTNQVGERIAVLCKSDMIKNIALYGAASFLSKVKQDILSQRTQFGISDVMVYINPIKLEAE